MRYIPVTCPRCGHTTPYCLTPETVPQFFTPYVKPKPKPKKKAR